MVTPPREYPYGPQRDDVGNTSPPMPDDSPTAFDRIAPDSVKLESRLMAEEMPYFIEDEDGVHRVSIFLIREDEIYNRRRNEFTPHVELAMTYTDYPIDKYGPGMTLEMWHEDNPDRRVEVHPTEGAVMLLGKYHFRALCYESVMLLGDLRHYRVADPAEG